MTDVRKAELEHQFYELLLTGCSLDHFCNDVETIIHNPVSIHLPTRTIIAKSKGFTQDLVDDFVNAFTLSPVADVTTVFDQIIGRLKKRPAITDAFPYYRHMQVLSGCFQNHHLLAILTCPVVNQTDLKEAEEAVALAAPVVAPLMRMNGYLDKSGAHHMQIYLAKLLKGEGADIHQQITASGSAIQGVKAWRLIQVRPDDEEKLPELLEKIDAICAVREKIWCVEHSGSVVILADAELKEKAEEVKSASAGQASVILSEPFVSLNQVPAMFGECSLALKIARFEDSTGNIIYV